MIDFILINKWGRDIKHQLSITSKHEFRQINKEYSFTVKRARICIFVNIVCRQK